MHVVVGLSGGVDSAAAVIGLLEAGHEVTGVFLRLGEPEPGPPPDLEAARHTAAVLGVPLLVRDARKAFTETVLVPSLERYAAGTTPNPCVLCNRVAKLAILETVADELGARAIATGHHARVERSRGGPVRLLRGRDRTKDQSYFLHRITPRQLERLLLPVGEGTKAKARERVREAGLEVADRPESQELCFVPEGATPADLVERWLPGAVRSGPIVDGEGRELGRHGGLHRFTIGQRRGLGVAAGYPLYVVALEPGKNAVRVGPAEALERDRIIVEDPSWPSGRAPRFPLECMVQIRARHRAVPATVEALDDGRLEVRFTRPVRAPAPGQAAVLYDGDTVLGGGWIAP